MKIEILIRKAASFQPILTKISISFAILMLVIPFLFYDFVKEFTFIVVYVWAILNYVLKGFTALLLIYAFSQIRYLKWRSFLPFLSCGIAVFVLTSTPFIQHAHSFRMGFELQNNKPKYNEIIQRVNKGDLKTSGTSRVIHLSPVPEDMIIVDQENGTTSIFFNTSWTSSNYVGFIYRSDDSVPPENLMDSYWVECIHEETNWYFCSSLD